jgi:uncharacterized protein
MYYSVMAIDKNQNHSSLSALLKVSLPDKIKPQPPVFLPVKSDEKGVTLTWIPSSSTDVVQYDVYRKAAGREEWQRLKMVPSTMDSTYTYSDSFAEGGKTNTYTITAIDDAGLESDPTTPVNAGRIDNALKPTVQWKEPIVERDKRQIRLQWAYEQAGVKTFQIFRSMNELPLKLYKTIPGNSLELVDQSMKAGSQYNYRILAVYENGAKSALSEERKVIF